MERHRGKTTNLLRGELGQNGVDSPVCVGVEGESVRKRGGGRRSERHGVLQPLKVETLRYDTVGGKEPLHDF